MKIQTVRCNECGGPLHVKPKVSYVSCNYCGASLKIQREANTIFTEVIEDLERKTAHLANDVKNLKLDKELEKLDRTWMDFNEKFKTGNIAGMYSIPDKDEITGRTIILFIVGIVIIVGGISFLGMSKFLIPLLIGVAIIGYTLFTRTKEMAIAGEYEEIQTGYEEKRKKLIAKKSELVS